jgi:hypothetical protein
MPSTRIANAVVTDEQRQSPPASVELRAPSSRLRRSEDRDREREDRKRGPKSEEESDAITQLTMRLMDKLTAAEIARKAEVDPRAVRTVIKAARASLASRAEFYVEAHAAATAVAALAGDAKPAQWAMERIAEEGERIVDAPEENKVQQAPTFTLGFVVGGMPAVKALPPVIDAETVKG